MSVCWFVCQTEDLVDLPVALGPKLLKHLRVSMGKKIGKMKIDF